MYEKRKGEQENKNMCELQRNTAERYFFNRVVLHSKDQTTPLSINYRDQARQTVGANAALWALKT